jgi:hypothetical protein
LVRRFALLDLAKDFAEDDDLHFDELAAQDHVVLSAPDVAADAFNDKFAARVKALSGMFPAMPNKALHRRACPPPA